MHNYLIAILYLYLKQDNSLNILATTIWLEIATTVRDIMPTPKSSKTLKKLMLSPSTLTYENPGNVSSGNPALMSPKNKNMECYLMISNDISNV